MSLNLNKEEERVYTILQVCRTIKVEQAWEINEGKPANIKRHAVVTLFKKGMLFYSKKRDYIMCNPRFKPDKRMTDALWILLRQIHNIDIHQVYSPQAPAILGFVKKNKCYEIIPVSDKTELKKVVEQINELYVKNAIVKEDSIIRYIMVIKNEDLINHMPDDVNFPYAFAVEKYVVGLKMLDVPQIVFYAPEENQEYE